jgi:hypothetical protein
VGADLPAAGAAGEAQALAKIVKPTMEITSNLMISDLDMDSP